MRSLSEVGARVLCLMLSLIFLRYSFNGHITVRPGGLHTTQSVLPASPLTFCVLDYSRTGWHGPAGNSTWEKAIDSTVCSAARRRGIAKKIIIQKCGTKTLQERGAEQGGGREGTEGLAEAEPVQWQSPSPWPGELHSLGGLGGTRHQTYPQIRGF